MTNHPNRLKAFLVAARNYPSLMPRFGEIALEALIHTAKHRQLDSSERSDVLHRFYDLLSPRFRQAFRRYLKANCSSWLTFRQDGRGLLHFRIIAHTMDESVEFVALAEHGMIPPFQIQTGEIPKFKP